MTSTGDLKHVPDDELLRRLSALLQQSRRVESVLIAHIAEVDARRLYAREAGSMFAYCTQVLHLSEHEAYARITVARASRRHPALLPMLADGRLHVSGIGKLVPHLTVANCDELLARATHKTKSEIEELIAALAPKPDVPPVIRQLPVRAPVAAIDGPSLGPSAPTILRPELGPDRVAAPRNGTLNASGCSASELGPDRVPLDLPSPSPSLDVPAHAIPPSAVTPLSPARYKVQFTASAELRDKLERLQALTQEDLATALEVAVTERLARLEAKRFGLTSAPRKSLQDVRTAPSSRYLPAPVRRIVRDRDGHRCAFVTHDGRRCTERRRLEFHHRRPYARGGSHSPDNICLMCRQHNAYLAELDYGKDHMKQFRRRPDRVSEGVPDYGDLVGCGEALWGMSTAAPALRYPTTPVVWPSSPHYRRRVGMWTRRGPWR